MQDDVDQSGFDVVFARGYDRRQVDDYVSRVDVALGEADDRHAADAARLAAVRAASSPRCASGWRRPRRAPPDCPSRPPASGSGWTEMLRLAEQEAEAMRAAAQRRGAGPPAGRAASRCRAETAERTAGLEARERDVASAGEEADRLRRRPSRTPRSCAPRPPRTPPGARRGAAAGRAGWQAARPRPRSWPARSSEAEDRRAQAEEDVGPRARPRPRRGGGHDRRGPPSGARSSPASATPSPPSCSRCATRSPGAVGPLTGRPTPERARQPRITGGDGVTPGVSPGADAAPARPGCRRALDGAPRRAVVARRR